MHSTHRTSGRTSQFYRFGTSLLLMALFSLSGNVFAQNEPDSLRSPRMIMDPATGELRPVSGAEIKPFKNYIVEVGASLAFPLQDFHAADPANERAGYACKCMIDHSYLFSTLGVKVAFT